MIHTIDDQLKKIGLDLPVPPPPQGHYVPWVISGNLVFLAGQIALVDGALRYAGSVPNQVSLNDAKESARLCAINLLAQLRSACNGELDRVSRILKLGGFVACDSSFLEHPKVINGASELFASVFEEKAAHARYAVGTTSLPLGASVEVDAIVEIR